MSKRLTATFVIAAASAALLAVAWAFAAASPAASAPVAAKVRVVPIVMKDPGCHWFLVAGKDKVRLVVQGKTAFQNRDEAALVFTGKNYRRHLAVGKSLAVGTPGTYHITMVGQHGDDNHLTLVVT